MNSYFSFTREPFSRELAPNEVFVSRGHQELLARLHHAIDTGSLAVITGQVGCGKSTAIRSCVHSLDASRYRYIYLASSALSPAEFYRSLLHQVNIRPGRGISENKRLVTDAMMEMSQKGMRPLVVVDEAQDLSVPMLSEFRFVLNYRTDSFSPLMVILSGAAPAGRDAAPAGAGMHPAADQRALPPAVSGRGRDLRLHPAPSESGRM